MRSIHRGAVALAALLVANVSAAETKRPNIVVIVADDLGWNDVGFHNKEVRTPNLDKLVADGCRLDRHYSYPICSATRAALLTGMSTSRTGVNNSSGLDLSYHLLPETLKAAGYQTWMFGKWHLGGPADYERSGPKYLPHNRGFDYFKGFLHGAIDYVTHERKDLGEIDWQRNGETLKETGFTTDLLADDAVRMLKSRDKSRPVFLYLPFNAVHGPLSVPPGSNLDRRDRRRILLANVTYMDAAIGRVLKTIDSEGLRENTLVLFLSDNGGQLSQGASNEPWRGEKGTVFEGGIHTPAIVRFPGVIKAGSKSGQVVSVIDWFPTLATAAGVKPGNTAPFDGRDLWSYIRDGKTTPPENVVIAQGGVAILHGPWKLVNGSDQKAEKGGKGGAKGGGAAAKKARPAQKKGKAAENTRPMLFRIDTDPGEKNDLASKYPDVVEDLTARAQAMTRLAPKRKRMN